MLSAKSESDITSLAPSSPSRSPKRPVYYVQSPSRDSHDGDKSSSMQATPIYNNSPMESPSHPSFGRHSRNSSASRFSGIFRSSSGRKGSRKRNDKGWPECNVILEEGSYDDLDDKAFTRRCQGLLALLSFVLLFTTFCLIIWGASRPYKAEISIKSLAVNNLYFGEGSDSSGVPTKMLTVNGSLRMNIYNPAPLFGIHVSSTPVNLVYSEITVATGQLKKYYQPRKSHRTVSVNLVGNKVPLYGAGSSITVSSPNGGKVPLTLKFQIRSRGDVVGKLVRVKHRRQISCPLVIDSSSTKPIKFKENSCTYE
uniref:Late embryogenisis abundant protein 6 n=1 Tax=Betula platyphylla TaxID=78630 RepID=A0A223FWK3_BETPL|nr:late embryogenisis abundant protein 6 [Betula platyphylla]